MKKFLSLFAGFIVTATAALAVPPAPAPVPETSSTLGLVALACLGMLLFGRRLTSKAATAT